MMTNLDGLEFLPGGFIKSSIVILSPCGTGGGFVGLGSWCGAEMKCW
jgi:hypothetical protein